MREWVWRSIRDTWRMRFSFLFSALPCVADVKSDGFWSIVADLFTHE